MMKRALTFLLLLASSSCVVEEDTAIATSPLTGSPETNELLSTVFLSFPVPNQTTVHLCTGIALTDHWIITAAHCFESGPTSVTVTSEDPVTGQAVTLYNGESATFYRNPGYDENIFGLDGSDDIALVQLEGAGMAAQFPRGELYVDERHPWVGSGVGDDQRFAFVAYGNGSDPGGPACDEPGLDYGIKRISEDNYIKPFQFEAEAVVTANGDTAICHGDSGGPWLLTRGGRRLAFAVSSYFGIYHEAVGTLIPPKLDWIEQATAAAGAPIECFDRFTSNGYRYRTCEDAPVVVIGLDAELGVLASPMTVASHRDASRAKFVHVPNGAPVGGAVRFTLNIPRAATYTVWGRVMGATTDDNLFDVAIDGGTTQPWGFAAGSTWVWDRVGNVANGKLYLTAGTHTIDVLRREDGARLDRLVVTSRSDFVPVERWIEAESGTLTAPMTTTMFFGGTAIWVPTNTPPPGGSARYTFSTPQPGHYIMWGREYAPTSSSNAFYVGVDGATTTWTTQVGTGFVWDRINNSVSESVWSLDPGSHRLVITRREAGNQLDRMLVTNDVGFVPADVPFGQF